MLALFTFTSHVAILTPFSTFVAPRAALFMTSSWPALDDHRDPSELRAEAKRVFDRINTSGSGLITMEEMLTMRYPGTLIRKIFYTMDTNFDGRIDEHEFMTAYMVHPTLRTAPGFGGTENSRRSS